ncbi:ABC transporter permease [Amycolatopsis sp. NPDC051903]|uniref:ABC transporter permease n=1 Tax=Amycolatopsis sp. NPDC051903 TaxID=3363936 RepID=UPI00379FC706
MTHALRDSSTMLRRNLKHMLRYPSMTLMLLLMPVVFLLLFVYVFGGTLGAGLGGTGGGRTAYLEYVTPGIILMAVCGAVQGTSISVAMDMTQGIIARFRTMAISRGSVLTGHVLGSIIQAMLCVVVILGIAFAIGFRTEANFLQWLGVAGMLLLLAFALTWLTVALGLVTKSVETASNLPMPLILLPFLGSGFVPTDSMPTALRWFAEYQPFTPVMETLRALLHGTTTSTTNVALGIGWCVAISLGGYFWARKLFERNIVR